jgi:hypothetical protein
MRLGSSTWLAADPERPREPPVFGCRGDDAPLAECCGRRTTVESGSPAADAPLGPGAKAS